MDGECLAALYLLCCHGHHHLFIQTTPFICARVLLSCLFRLVTSVVCDMHRWIHQEIVFSMCYCPRHLG